MAAEVMVRRGLDLDVHRWLDRYLRRLVFDRTGDPDVLAAAVHAGELIAAPA